MKLTKQSELLMGFLLGTNCLHNIPQTAKTDNVFSELYLDIYNADIYIKNIANSMPNFYDYNILNNIQKPNGYTSKAFPEKIRNHIEDNNTQFKTIKYTYQLFGKYIEIMFITNKPTKKYNQYVEYILTWLKIASKYSSTTCANTLKIYIYLTELTKVLPSNNSVVLDEYNVNTAYTTTCPVDSEIVIFRKEEWFKVLIHETFHNFGLDFSDANVEHCHRILLDIFPVNSKVNAFESYTEFWARIFSVLFCSYTQLTDKKNIDDFLTHTEFFMNIERNYSCIQMVKVLDFMGISYNCLYEKSRQCSQLRDTFYKEDTNVLAYYILTFILINNYQSFLWWCSTNNTNILKFKGTQQSQIEFCKFIEKYYKNKSLLECLECSEGLLVRLKNVKKAGKNVKETKFLLENLRMTVCELG
jgi:hypothetical protein